MQIALSTGLDILMAATFIFCVIIAARKGLVKSIIGFVGNIAALIIAFIFSVDLGVYINTNYLREPMQQWLVNILSPTASGAKASVSGLDLDQLFADMPSFFTDAAKFLNINLSEMASKYEEMKINGIEQAKAAVVNAMTQPLSEIVSRIIAFLIIFLICIIAVNILWWLSDLIVNIPVIRQLDCFGGIIFGIINAFLVSFILVSVMNVSLVYILKDKTYEERENIKQNTFIYKNIDNINPLNSLFENW